VPVGLDKGGQDLQTVLRLRHEGAAAAGEAGVPALTDDVEHRLASGSPEALALSSSPGGSCPLLVAAGAPATPPAPGNVGPVLPATGATIPLSLALAGLALALVTIRFARRED
jgi:LPXTG-motif cell wall-anchored protein